MAQPASINNLRIISAHTPDGLFNMILDSQDRVRVSGFDTVEAVVKRLPTELVGLPTEIVASHPYEEYIQAYYSGDARALSAIPQFQQGTGFQKRVWQAIAAVPQGSTISYKELAQQSGNPTAIRAAGTICGLNRLILLVPCHRVLKSDGGIGSYLYGPTIKESLLRHEGAIM